MGFDLYLLLRDSENDLYSLDKHWYFSVIFKSINFIRLVTTTKRTQCFRLIGLHPTCGVACVFRSQLYTKISQTSSYGCIFALIPQQWLAGDPEKPSFPGYVNEAQLKGAVSLRFYSVTALRSYMR